MPRFMQWVSVIQQALYNPLWYAQVGGRYVSVCILPPLVANVLIFVIRIFTVFLQVYPNILSFFWIKIHIYVTVSKKLTKYEEFGRNWLRKIIAFSFDLT